MKRLFTALAMLYLVSNSAFCQDLRLMKFDEYSRLTDDQKESDTIQFITQGALNLYFNKQISKQLSGKEDLSLSKSYALLSNSDGELTFGYSKSPSKSEQEFIPFILQTGIKVKSKDKFGTIFSSGSGLAASAGFFLKGTFLTRGTMTFGYRYKSTEKAIEKILSDEEQAAENRIKTIQGYEKYLNDKFQVQYKKDTALITKDAAAQVQFLRWSSTLQIETLKSSVRDSLIEEHIKQKKAEYAEQVEKYLVSNKLFVGSHKCWLSFDLFVAAIGTEYFTVPDYTADFIDTISLRPHYLNIIGSYLYSRSSGFTFFLSGGPSVKVHNSITLDEMTKTSYGQIYQGPNSGEYKLKNSDVYVGDLSKFIIMPSLNAKFTVMFGGRLSVLGLSSALEYQFAPGDDIWYLKWGVPLNLKGEKDDVRVNVEPQVRWDTKNETFVFGLSLGVPFGQKLY